MKFALHGMVTMYSNIMSDIQLARQAGYEGVELHTDKLWRFLDAGGTSAMCNEALNKYNVEAVAIDIIGGVEAADKDDHRKMLKEAQVLSQFASEIGVGTIQLNAFEGLNALSAAQNIAVVSDNIREICKIGKEFGIRFQYEGAAWTPIHTLADCVALVEAVGMPNFGLVIDFWHFWASRGATVGEIARLDKDMVYAVHCCGGSRPSDKDRDAQGALIWQDERRYRGYFPGDKDDEVELLPVQEWVDAVLETGFDGWVSGEFLNEELWEKDNLENASIMKERLDYFFPRKS